MASNSHNYTIDPIKETDLLPGKVYYVLSFSDRDLLIPDIVTVEYSGLGTNNGKKIFIFEKYDCRLPDKVSPKEKQNISQQFYATETSLANIVDILGLISALERCKRRIDIHQLR